MCDSYLLTLNIFPDAFGDLALIDQAIHNTYQANEVTNRLCRPLMRQKNH